MTFEFKPGMNLMDMGLAMQAATIGKTLADYPNTPRGDHDVLKARGTSVATPPTATSSLAEAMCPPDLFKVQCPSCRGTLVNEQERRCGRCDATGFIEVRSQKP